jgi:hypothetical protein
MKARKQAKGPADTTSAPADTATNTSARQFRRICKFGNIRQRSRRARYKYNSRYYFMTFSYCFGNTFDI